MPDIGPADMLNTYQYLKLLQLRKGATRQEIRDAYRKHAFQFHPDRNREKGHLFPFIHEAYRALMGDFNNGPPGRGTQRANHNLSFVKENIKKIKPRRNNGFFPLARKVNDRERQCENCGGYGMIGSHCLPMAPCRDCLGTGLKLR